jgi:hypothetical protein
MENKVEAFVRIEKSNRLGSCLITVEIIGADLAEKIADRIEEEVCKLVKQVRFNEKSEDLSYLLNNGSLDFIAMNMSKSLNSTQNKITGEEVISKTNSDGAMINSSGEA